MFVFKLFNVFDSKMTQPAKRDVTNSTLSQKIHYLSFITLIS